MPSGPLNAIPSDNPASFYFPHPGGKSCRVTSYSRCVPVRRCFARFHPRLVSGDEAPTIANAGSLCVTANARATPREGAGGLHRRPERGRQRPHRYPDSPLEADTILDLRTVVDALGAVLIVAPMHLQEPHGNGPKSARSGAGGSPAARTTRRPKPLGSSPLLREPVLGGTLAARHKRYRFAGRTTGLEGVPPSEAGVVALRRPDA